MGSNKPLNLADLQLQIKPCQPFLFCASHWMALAEGWRAEWHLEKELLLAGTAAMSLVSRAAARGWALFLIFGQSCFPVRRSSQACLWFGCWGQKECVLLSRAFEFTKARTAKPQSWPSLFCC